MPMVYASKERKQSACKASILTSKKASISTAFECTWLRYTPKRLYSPTGCSKHLLETPFLLLLLLLLLLVFLLLLRTLWRNPVQTPSKNSSKNLQHSRFQYLRTPFSEPFLEAFVVARPLRRAPKWSLWTHSNLSC